MTRGATSNKWKHCRVPCANLRADPTSNLLWKEFNYLVDFKLLEVTQTNDKYKFHFDIYYWNKVRHWNPRSSVNRKRQHELGNPDECDGSFVGNGLVQARRCVDILLRPCDKHFRSLGPFRLFPLVWSKWRRWLPVAMLLNTSMRPHSFVHQARKTCWSRPLLSLPVWVVVGGCCKHKLPRRNLLLIHFCYFLRMLIRSHEKGMTKDEPGTVMFTICGRAGGIIGDAWTLTE